MVMCRYYVKWKGADVQLGDWEPSARLLEVGAGSYDDDTDLITGPRGDEGDGSKRGQSMVSCSGSY